MSLIGGAHDPSARCAGTSRRKSVYRPHRSRLEDPLRQRHGRREGTGRRRGEDEVAYGARTRYQPGLKVTTLTIRDIDFDYGGFKHALRLEWVLRDKDNGRELDHRFYIFAPGKGLVHLR